MNIFEAARTGNVDFINNFQGDVNEAHYYETPLMYAAKNGQVESIKALIKKGADVNALDNSNYSALLYATNFCQGDEHKNAALELIAAGADVNIQSNEGRTALMYGFSNCDAELIKNLINAGANVDLADIDGETARFYAARYRKNQINILMETGADVSAINKLGKTSLFFAASYKNGSFPLVKELIEYGADVNACDNQNCTVLNDVEYWNKGPEKEKIRKILIDFGAGNVNADKNVLHAVMKGNLDSLRSLLEKGIDIEAISAALIPAILKGNLKVVKLLIEKGADVNISNHSKETALWVAVKQGQIDVIKELLEAKPDLNAKDNQGRTVLKLAKLNKINTDIIRILKKAGGK